MKPNRLPGKQQQRCLDLLAEGFLYKEIAARMGLSEHTVVAHLLKLRNRCGAHSQVQLIMAAWKRGWIKRQGA